MHFLNEVYKIAFYLFGGLEILVSHGVTHFVILTRSLSEMGL